MAGRSTIAFESRFDRTPAEVWRVVSNSNRGNEVTVGLEPYTAEDVLQADGSVIRYGRGRMGPFRVEWEEGFGEWVENRYIRQVRRYKTGPMRSLGIEFRLLEDGGGTRVEFDFEATWDSLLGAVLYKLGVLDKLSKEVVRTCESAVAALERPK
ncbi:MAG: SRPBCC family protein, partial [Alphaproteobacteria bacterium]